MPIERRKKLENRMKRLGKYQIVLLKVKFPISSEDYLLSAFKRGKYLEWIIYKRKKLTRDYMVFLGHDVDSKRYFKIYYTFLNKIINGFAEQFEESLL